MNLHNDSLWIGRLIKMRIEDLAPVYPVIAPEGAPAEFCTYRRTGYSGRDTKDIYNYEERVNIVINIAAPSYGRSLELAQAVKDRLDGLRGTFEDNLISFFTLTNASEDYGPTDYVQTLYFTVCIDTSFNKK